MIRHAFALSASALLGFGLLVATCQAGPKVTLGRNVATAQQVSMDQIDHAPWNALLARYVDADGMVDYRAWKAAPADVRQLDAYLNSLSTASPRVRASRGAQLAFWINAYNAVTVKGILREYPTTSIRNHTPRLWGYHIWHDLLLTVGGQAYSLHQIEHDVLRKQGDPRIHFAIVCASRGCPRLLNVAYTAATVEEQLSLNSRDFFARKQNFQYDVRARSIRLSSIMDWYADDFGSDTTALLKRIAPYLPDAAARQLAVAGNARVAHLDYDWNLNEQTSRRAARGR